jgi:CheY-like chemotaxis protein
MDAMNRVTKNPVSAKPRVFVVDDEPMLLELAAAVLESVGCEVRTFRDPELALKAFPSAPPDVVITDYAMGA